MFSTQDIKLNDLPNELLANIFSFLDEKEIFSCALTCKQFTLILKNYGNLIFLDSWKNTIKKLPVRAKTLSLLKMSMGRFPEIDKLSVFSQTNKFPATMDNQQLSHFFKKKHELELKIKKCDRLITGGDHVNRDLAIRFLIRTIPIVLGVCYTEASGSPIGIVVGMVVFTLSIGKCMWNIVRDESNGIHESSELIAELTDHLIENAKKIKKLN